MVRAVRTASLSCGLLFAAAIAVALGEPSDAKAAASTTSEGPYAAFTKTLPVNKRAPFSEVCG